jgi:hypothetical protein
MPKPTPGDTPTLRHSGLDPKSSSSIKFSGALRRRKRFWIPGQARNDEGFSSMTAYSSLRRAWALVSRRKIAALRAGMYNRRTAAFGLVQPTGRFFASPGVSAKNKGE